VTELRSGYIISSKLMSDVDSLEDV